MDKTTSGKVGRYEIILVLGRGDIGEMILAEDQILRPQGDDQKAHQAVRCQGFGPLPDGSQSNRIPSAQYARRLRNGNAR
jgi:hypothetical protein